MTKVSRSFFGTIQIVDCNNPNRLYLKKEVHSKADFADYIKKYGESAPYQSILKASVVPLRSNGSFKFVQDILFPTLSHRMDIKNVDSVIGSTSRVAKTTWAIMAVALDILTLIPRLISVARGKIKEIEKHPIISELERKDGTININYFKMIANINYFRMIAKGKETTEDGGVETDNKTKKFSVIINISTNGLTEIDPPKFRQETKSEFFEFLGNNDLSSDIEEWLFKPEPRG